MRTTVRSLKREGEVRAMLKEGGADPGDRLSAKVLKRRIGESAVRVPTWQLPDWLVRVAALRDPAVKLILPELGKVQNATNEKARRLLGWAPRPNEEAIVATAESLVRLGLLKDSSKRAA